MPWAANPRCLGLGRLWRGVQVPTDRDASGATYNLIASVWDSRTRGGGRRGGQERRTFLSRDGKRCSVQNRVSEMESQRERERPRVRERELSRETDTGMERDIHGEEERSKKRRNKRKKVRRRSEGWVYREEEGPVAPPPSPALTADLGRGVLGDHGVGGELGVQDAAVRVGVHGQRV